MTINVEAIPDGTLCVVRYGDETHERVVVARAGYLYGPNAGARLLSEWDDQHVDPNHFPGSIVRTFSPDPTPDQEVPREEWASIKAGSRVRVEWPPITPGVFGGPFMCEGDWTDIDGTLGVGSASRVYLLDDPAGPDADLIPDIKAAILEHFNDVGGNGFRLNADAAARAALATVRRADQ